MTTISAAPVGPGETKFIGLGDKFSYVKSVLLSQVVEYCYDYDERLVVVKEWVCKRTYNIVNLLCSDEMEQEKK